MLSLKLFRTANLFIALSFVCVKSFGQGKPAVSVNTLIGKINDFDNKLPGEKVYMQFDKPYYSVGDTIWFKGYIFNPTLNYSPLSSRLYIELINDSNKVIKRIVTPVGFGVTWGNITLAPDFFREGVYTIRAYTNWMRNFPDDRLYYHDIYISNPGDQSWLINTNSTADKNGVKIGLKFNDIVNKPDANQEVQLKLMDGKKTLYRNSIQTDATGSADVNFNLPDNTAVKNLQLIAESKNHRRWASIPVKTSRIQDVDVQFMPESGYLVANLPATIGFKTLGQDGKGINLKGVILNKENTEITQFETTHKGMGIFYFTPETGETYSAKVTLPDGGSKTVALPAVKSWGTIIKVQNAMDRDSIHLSVVATDDLLNKGNLYYLVGQSRGIVCYGASIKLNDKVVTTYIPKNAFPTGVAHFTLFNSNNQPINERITFINHHDNLNISLNTASAYKKRDSIPMHITVKDNAGKPIMGSFSVAVTDDQQVKQTADQDNIVTQTLLSSDVRGYIEDPSHYFEHSSQAWQDLDALLLTQGWVGFNWKDIITTEPKPVYLPEPEFMVRGKVTNLFNKGIAKSKVTLLSTGKYHILKDTLTNSEGNFTFKHFPLIDSTKFILTAANTRGKTVNGGITVNEDSPMPVTSINHTPIVPWYVNIDSTMFNYVKTNNAYHNEMEKMLYGRTGRMLGAVNIRDRAIIKGSQNLNGPGNSDQTITPAQIEKAGKASLLDLIEQTVKGFRVGYMRKSSNQGFFIKDKRVRFVLDGIDLDRFYEPMPGMPNAHYEYQKQTLDYLTAEDILGIEVLYSSRYNQAYHTQNLSIAQQMAINPAGPSGSDIAYLEITTRSGQGPFMRRANGIYVYKPTPLSLPKLFYSPKYPVKNAHPNFADLRSTILWQPGIVTNKNGETTVTFYAADRPTTYTVILEGTDLNGKVGYQTKKITINPGE